MTKSFNYESRSQPHPGDPDKYGMLEIYVVIECRNPDGTDPTWCIEFIENTDTNAEVHFEKLPHAEQAAIGLECAALARENAIEAAYEYQEGLSDWLHDTSKEP